ncbi:MULTISPECIES: hypothetical protein [unclassified Pedobacter]|jgi:hypothetical protein|uniref:hypothetical protein n=1 Tax=unclassified Pedobacter TaxID=2628915 RepID=UPI000D3D480C|nr:MULTISPECIES: hypothetical protein [unclassified Pedobacter]PTT03868.1 hypothetical protein DBR11_01035 [Pedobacter sp. HMWF019]HWW43056.1 hypothetical protein [Pedobacter sp.]
MDVETNAMEPFEITVLTGGREEQLVVLVDPNDSKYQVFEEQSFLGKIWADIDEVGIIWSSADLIAPELVQQIGEQIEIYDQ